MSTMSVVNDLDHLIQKFNEFMENSCEDKFLRYVIIQELNRLQWKDIHDQYEDLKAELSNTNSKLQSVKNSLKSEIKHRKEAEKENRILTEQLSKCTCTLINYSRKSTRSSHYCTAEDGIQSEEESDDSYLQCRDLKRHSVVKITVGEPPVAERHEMNAMYDRNDANSILLFTPKTSSDTSVEEGVHEIETNSSSDSSRKRVAEQCLMKKLSSHEIVKLSRSSYISLNTTYMTTKNHKFTRRNMVVVRNCVQCKENVERGMSAFVCINCQNVVHVDCYQNLSAACTPTEEVMELNSISELAPKVPPMIPSPVVHCVKEIEKRGLKQVGIYKMPGIEEEISTLKEDFPDWKYTPDLSQFGVHTLCNYLKEYFNNVNPLIPKANETEFKEATAYGYKKAEKLYVAISRLPQAHRDTLAFLMIHLRKVASSMDCKMNVSSVASVFGPLIFGLSNEGKENKLCEPIAVDVMKELLKLPNGYWHSFIVEPKTDELPEILRSTPSTEEIVRQAAHKYFSTPKRRRKFFPSPLWGEDN